jgi:hypothetical protein
MASFSFSNVCLRPRRRGLAQFFVLGSAALSVACQSGTSGAPAPAARAAAVSAATPAATAKPTPAAAAPAVPSAPAVVAAAPAPQAASPGGKGPAASADAFSVWLQSTSPLKAGQPAKLELILEAKSPFHCNTDYPHKLKLDAAGANIRYPESEVRGMHVTPLRSVLEVPLVPQQAGITRVSGIAQFSVCNDAQCLIEKEPVSVDVEVL